MRGVRGHNGCGTTPRPEARAFCFQGCDVCTNFKMKKAADGSVVVGRSMEFPNVMPYSLAVLPVGFQGESMASGGVAGKAWTGTYGVVGIATLAKPGWLTDGLNTQGLSAHLLYMAGGFCAYPEFVGDGTDVSQCDLTAYLLTTCATVEDVKNVIGDIRIWGADPGVGFVAPIHLFVHDSTSSIAVELRHDATVSVVDNPTSVGTNAPYLDWHLLNLANYVGFSGWSPGEQSVDGLTLAPFGQGQGLSRLPGGYTPPDRFVRAAVLSELAFQSKDGRESEQMVGHLLNSFDIVPGTVLEHMGDHVVSEETTYDAIFNLTELRLAYRTVTDPTWYCVDLATVDFTAPARLAPISFAGGYVPVTI